MSGKGSEVRCVSSSENLEALRFLNDGFPTFSSEEQERVEKSVSEKFKLFRSSVADKEEKWPPLQRDRHLTYLHKGWKDLPEGYECLDASRPWICYWILHSMELLGEKVSPSQSSEIAQFLGKCQCEDGGFGGGPQQQAHLAPTYAAVLALCTLGTEEAYQVIDRAKLQSFILRMRTPEGSFRMHDGGEVDIRGAYCAAVAARLTNIVIPEMFDLTAEWIAGCQTYEGGFAGEHGMEAHGGYSFCGIAALVLLGHERLCDMQSFLRWLTHRQMRYEGGFQGRTNKLVDGCYSFWQAGAFPVIHNILNLQEDMALSGESWLFDQDALQEYVLICCQHLHGGLLDKPGKPRDYYHTCYCLSGMSVAQHFMLEQQQSYQVMGDTNNELQPAHPLYNIGVKCAHDATVYFSTLPVPQLKR